MNNFQLPPVDEIRRRLELCEIEQKALRKLLRLSSRAECADKARAEREKLGAIDLSIVEPLA